jgi:hypothetical protein
VELKLKLELTSWPVNVIATNVTLEETPLMMMMNAFVTYFRSAQTLENG